MVWLTGILEKGCVNGMDAEKLSQRLQTVADFVPQGARLADIGTDHAYLPAALVLAGRIDFAVAGDVTLGPLQNATAEIERLHLSEQIQPRLADGLAAIQPTDQIDTVVIAGMGGTLIAKILTAGAAQLAGVKRLILQPNVGEARVRQWLMEHHYQLMAERIVAEDGHIYEILVADYTGVPFSYNARELRFGPFLLAAGGPIFRQKWQEELQREAAALEQMKAAKEPPLEKIAAFQAQLAQIKEALA